MRKPGPKRIMIVDDQIIILEGLSALLNGDPEFVVVGTANSGEMALKMLGKLWPDVVVMDISMPPGMDGIETTARIKQVRPECQVLMLSMYHKADMVNDALNAGASGYVLKNTTQAQFKEALRTVAQRMRFLSPEVEKDLAAVPVRPRVDKQPVVISLTTREKEIIKMIVRESTTAQIAERMGISARCV